jgi:transcriptional regulator with XRE-family HTH domain
METHEKIRFIRMFKGWTQEEMAEKLGMALNGYAKIERGEVDINISRLNQIAEVLGVETTQLIGLNEKNVFNFIENSYNLVHNQSNGCYINQVETKHQLEKALLVIEQKDKEITYLQEIIRLLNNDR